MRVRLRVVGLFLGDGGQRTRIHATVWGEKGGKKNMLLADVTEQLSNTISCYLPLRAVRANLLPCLSYLSKRNLRVSVPPW